jgi:hypothetical protein
LNGTIVQKVVLQRHAPLMYRSTQHYERSSVVDNCTMCPRINEPGSALAAPRIDSQQTQQCSIASASKQHRTHASFPRATSRRNRTRYVGTKSRNLVVFASANSFFVDYFYLLRCFLFRCGLSARRSCDRALCPLSTTVGSSRLLRACGPHCTMCLSASFEHL